MSIFGYPATVTHYHSEKDGWGRPLPPTITPKSAKVDEEQRIIKNAKGEEVQIAYTIHLEGAHAIESDDYFEYVNKLGKTITVRLAHYEVKKHLGTDDVKKVIVYG